MTTNTETPAKKAAPRKTVNKDKVHEAEKQAAEKIEAERQASIDKRDNPPAVHIAWSNVMDEVRGLAKSQRNTTPGQNYMFRGIDSVMNAVGPALRKHRVTVIPWKIDVERRDVTTSTGKPSRETTVEVVYEITGPAGDVKYGTAPGEAMDSGDKGTAKAMSVAYRTFLLQALTLPTDERDPDEDTHERGAEPTLAQKVANNLPRLTETVKLETNVAWAAERGLLEEQVVGPDGPITLQALIEIHRRRISDREAQVAHSTGATPRPAEDLPTPADEAAARAEEPKG